MDRSPRADLPSWLEVCTYCIHQGTGHGFSTRRSMLAYTAHRIFSFLTWTPASFNSSFEYSSCVRSPPGPKVLKLYQKPITKSNKATAATKYHLILGSGSEPNKCTFMPKKPDRKVNGRKTKVIQERRHREALSSRDWRASRIATLLYICSNVSMLVCQSRMEKRAY